ncbi:N-acetylglucosamine-specific PTS transporter subunit IIBC [Pseudovibrio exalbescens]|uniref:PTS N-acetyl-D-glucosamine transporter n=1 Tax=Pseudovibrio exalbescens TaxID=197461 RepID=A0A1U7JGW1_9HYPH|nr:N-acetylglucosamine-specific PTS transporter subunit IIBC [Pseudovibrio exalbescens]OKL43935.1 PTS N-acetyl-D-glucosamine transporter [Pseudovibrio exalbescens]
MSNNAFAGVQHLGRSLMLPIAVLPVAAILLRVGQPDLLNIPFVAAAGGAIFSNLGMLFAVGIAVGFAKENHGAAGLAGLVGFLIAQQGAVNLAGLEPDAASTMEGRIAIPIGIIMGVVAGMMYNKYNSIKLPDYLAFFGGRRFVPIVTGLAALVVAAAFGYGWAIFDAALTGLTNGITHMGEIGLFLYGALNRLLIVTGLHHILNNIIWFLMGDFTNSAGQVVTGDLNRFFAGDPTAGAYMAGFFPVMMFGLPAACLAMYQCAKPENRAAVGGVLASMALTSFLTGITEPIEFAFMFLAPALYLIHAILTGVSLVVMDLLNVKLGFGFSAGLFDYVINFGISTNPLMLIPVGAAFFAIYYFIFVAAIKFFDLKTMGRETAAEAAAETTGEVAGTAMAAAGDDQAGSYLQALGGVGNVLDVDACATRLRVTVADNAAVNEAALKGLGAHGVVKPAAGSVQVIVGPIADQLAGDVKEALKRTAPRPAASASRAASYLVALGGAANLTNVDACATRLRLNVVDGSKVDEAALKRLGAHGVVKPAAGSVQVIVGPIADQLSSEIKGEMVSA